MTTPPQGQNPFAQNPPPGAPQGGNPYGQTAPMGAAPYPQQGGPFPGAPVPPQNSGKKKAKIIAVTVAALVVGALAIGGYIASQDDAATAKVGDCMHQGKESTTDPDLEVVDCGESKAEFKVTGRVKGTFALYDDAKATKACREVTDDFEMYYAQSGGGEDFLLCLKQLKPGQ